MIVLVGPLMDQDLSQRRRLVTDGRVNQPGAAPGAAAPQIVIFAEEGDIPEESLDPGNVGRRIPYECQGLLPGCGHLRRDGVDRQWKPLREVFPGQCVAREERDAGAIGAELGKWVDTRTPPSAINSLKDALARRAIPSLHANRCGGTVGTHMNPRGSR